MECLARSGLHTPCTHVRDNQNNSPEKLTRTCFVFSTVLLSTTPTSSSAWTWRMTVLFDWSVSVATAESERQLRIGMQRKSEIRVNLILLSI